MFFFIMKYNYNIDNYHLNDETGSGLRISVGPFGVKRSLILISK